MLLSSKVFAANAVFDYKYSEWSTKYPSGLSEIFIESEVRYKWYKFEDGKINYINEYHTSYDGYEKDMSSARTYYRYITNDKIVVDYKNDLVRDENYCKQNYCYLKKAGEITLVETVGKDNNDNYENQEMLVVDSEENPYTVDSIVYYVLISGISLLSVLLLVFYKKRKCNSD